MTSTSKPFITIAVPVLNEEKFVRPMLQSLGIFDNPKSIDYDYEVIIVDGGSTDGTLAILEEYEAKSLLKVFHNNKRIQAAGINLASRQADPRSKYLIRIDAHAIYEQGFINNVVSALEASSAQSVVVPLITRPYQPTSDIAWAITLAQRSLMGNGGSAHRVLTSKPGPVEHGHHAGFNLEFFRAIGGYDESFPVNEDAEYDMRVSKNNGVVWFEPKALAWYSPRETIRSLAQQYLKYGDGRARTVLKHGSRIKLRQAAPIILTISNVISCFGVLYYPIFAFPLVAYACLCLCSVLLVVRHTDVRWTPSTLFQSVAALATMHTTWAIGFLKRVLWSRFLWK
jgi:succinoglycan biosynthesis protein ExoA